MQPAPIVNQSMPAMLTVQTNFTPQTTATISATSTSSSATFVPVPGVIRQTLEIYNDGPNNAYIGWGAQGQAVATVPTGTFATNCMVIPAKAIKTHDFIVSSGSPSVLNVVDTIAAITKSTETATLYVTVGSGQ